MQISARKMLICVSAANWTTTNAKVSALLSEIAHYSGGKKFLIHVAKVHMRWILISLEILADSVSGTGQRSDNLCKYLDIILLLRCHYALYSAKVGSF